MQHRYAAIIAATMIVGVAVAGAAPLAPPQEFTQDFEADRAGWFDWGGTMTRVQSGVGNGDGYLDGVTSASGSYHASTTGAFTYWGGYDATFPSGGYTTELDIYLDMDLGLDDARFDWISAVSSRSGTLLREFTFNGAYYTDTGFMVDASFASGAGAAPGGDAITIGSQEGSGWYTFRHQFYDDGGTLACDMSIWNGTANVNTWTLTGESMDQVGGNNHGWLLNDGRHGDDRVALPEILVDDSYRSGESTPAQSAESPEPATWLLLACTGAAGAFIRRKRDE